MAQWYYGENGQQTGPVDDETVRQAISAGQLGPNTLVWREGMPNWLPLQQVPELSGGTIVSAYSQNPYGTPYAPPAYGQPYGGAPGTSGLAIASMVCGIVGALMFMCMGGILGIPAVICGHMALKQINEASFPMGGRGMAITGLILGYLSIGLLILGILSVVFSAATHP